MDFPTATINYVPDLHQTQLNEGEDYRKHNSEFEMEKLALEINEANQEIDVASAIQEEELENIDMGRINQMKTNNGKTDTVKVDLRHLYDLMVGLRKSNIIDHHQELYQALNIRTYNTKNKTRARKKILTNINYKLKNLICTYPHLSFYGESKDFIVPSIMHVPEVLVLVENDLVKKRFREYLTRVEQQKEMRKVMKESKKKKAKPVH